MGFPVIGDVARRVDVLKARYADRDRRHELVRAVRAGDTDLAFPGMFPSQWPKPIVANFIDVVARDLAEISAPLPAFSCGTSKTMDETSRSRADKRTRIGNYYVESSRLATQMFLGMDYYYTYGFTTYWVEPNFEESRPHIRVEDSYGAYPEFDRWGNCTGLAKRFLQREYELVNLFPEAARRLMGPFRNEPSNTMHEVIRWTDDERTVLFLPGASRNASEGPTVLAEYANPLGRCPVVIAGRPDLTGEQHGQFDDVI